ncbi:hypothetical protein CVT24_012527 [Panaeolus cyanescens]|uniref:IRG-type G domain-containing protein n=1 Tax=Panaeolus cyanescens TaxID=181874 RepID=A0A409YK47_9AGAR|nr:hypothetical protein CVT24_012527 [Panaeolus cyanescens]
MDTLRNAANVIGLGGGRAAVPTATNRLLKYAPHPYFLAAGAVLSAGQLAFSIYDAVNRAEQRKVVAIEAEVKAREARKNLEETERKAEAAIAGRIAAEEKARQAEDLRAEAIRQREAAEAAQAQADEARRQAEERLMQGIPPEFRPTEEGKLQFRQRYGVRTDKINIAIVGESGVGKSSLLNSLRGLSPGDPNAARSGFNETTDFVRGYADTRDEKIVWYDVPGANTPRVQGWMYFVQQGLFVFDVLVIVFADRFTQTAGTLINNANKCSIPAFLVRTKADQLIYNAKSDAARPLSDQAAREMVVDQTRHMVEANLAQLGLPNQRVYIVSRTAMKKLVLNQPNHDIIDEQMFLDDIIDFECLDGSSNV